MHQSKMKYVRLIAKPNTWFKIGDEVIKNYVSKCIL